MGALSCRTDGERYVQYFSPRHAHAIHQNLSRPDEAVEAWKRAVAALPVENLTPAQEKQRATYVTELAAAEAKLADLLANPKQPDGASVVGANDQHNLPWNKAYALLPDYQARQVVESSVRFSFLPLDKQLALDHNRI